MQFNIWNPFVVDPTHVTFDVTPRGIALLKSGTSSFVSACLRACGLQSPAVKQWNVTAVRQVYYSDYSDSDDWRARWDLGWVLDVTLDEQIAMRNAFRPFPYTTEETDGSSSEPGEPSLSVSPALVVGGFKDTPSVDQLVQDAVQAWSREYRPEGGVTTRIHRYDDGFVHVRILVDDVRFPEQLEALDVLNRTVRESGGVTEWRMLVAGRRSES